ncbi:MAG: chain length determinant protein EpsF [Azoarcus sp.]|jgi:chain length determinant protein EpsF|nr:chain length determinant protein EpsF [Azoarcus sp.]
MTFQQFLLILKARRWVIAAILAGVMLLTLAISLLLPKQYTATSTLVVDMKMTDPLLGAIQPQMLQGYLATQIDIIASERVAQRVVTLTRMDQVPSLREQWNDEAKGEGGDAGFRAWLGALLQRQLDVRPSTTRESNIITISYEAPDPAFSAAIANAFSQAYIETNLELKVNPARQYKDWFDKQTKDVRDELESAQRKLSAYEQESGVLAEDGRLDVENMRLSELNSQLSAALVQNAESSSRQSQAASAESLPEVMADSVVASLKTGLAQLVADRSQLLERLGPNHPQIRELNEKITEQRNRLSAEIQRVVNSLGTTSRISTARIKELSDAVEKQQARVFELKKHRDQIAVFQRDIENAQRAYDLVTQRLAQTSLESQTQQTNVSVLTPAMPPLQHSSPKLVLNMIIATFLGVLLGIGVALLLELSDQRVRGREDLAEYLEAPLLGVVPGLNKSRFGFRARGSAAA